MSYVQRKNTTIKDRLCIDKIYILSGWKLLSLFLITIYNNKVIAIYSEIKVITKHEI